MKLVELAIPRKPEFVSVARLVVSSVVGDRYEITGDQLESLKLAVSEVCTFAIEGMDSSESIAIACEGTRDRIEVVVNNVTGLNAENEPLVPFIGSLVDNVEILEAAPSHNDGVKVTVFCDAAEAL